MISSSICESWMIKSWIIQVTQVIRWFACLLACLFISRSELGFEVISHRAASCQNPGQTFTPALRLKKTVIKSAKTYVACMLWKADKNFPFLPLYVSAHLFSAEARLTVDCHFLTAPSSLLAACNPCFLSALWVKPCGDASLAWNPPSAPFSPPSHKDFPQLPSAFAPLVTNNQNIHSLGYKSSSKSVFPNSEKETLKRRNYFYSNISVQGHFFLMKLH